MHAAGNKISRSCESAFLVVVGGCVNELNEDSMQRGRDIGFVTRNTLRSPILKDTHLMTFASNQKSEDLHPVSVQNRFFHIVPSLIFVLWTVDDDQPGCPPKQEQR